ncbi:hypothetical protein RhiLY_09991 [Ceratobasidium sp. AG-Ba]|nr:hypothetical protein RhiLY_09991 [Ceratobasidium sp. AG-Ba]
MPLNPEQKKEVQAAYHNYGKVLPIAAIRSLALQINSTPEQIQDHMKYLEWKVKNKPQRDPFVNSTPQHYQPQPGPVALAPSGNENGVQDASGHSGQTSAWSEDELFAGHLTDQMSDLNYW